MFQKRTRKQSIVLASLFGSMLITVAVGLNVGWIVLNWRTGLLLLGGIVSFAVLIAGVGLNTAFLIREIRRSEQHDAFIHAVTHELKTPLASIVLYLQTLKQRDVAPDKQREFVDTMLADTERLQSTIEQVLLAGKTRQARRPENPTEVDVAEVVSECVKVASRRHRLDDGTLTVVDRRHEGEDAVVMGDREELMAAVTNLVDNAIKYSLDRVEVVVEIARTSGRKLAVRVTDKGPGIPANELKRIFRRFYRLPLALSSRLRGTGLGLSIVETVAWRHGGSARAASRGPGQGSTFTLELPLKPAT